MTQSVNDEEVYNQTYKNNPPEYLWVYVCNILTHRYLKYLILIGQYQQSEVKY